MRIRPPADQWHYAHGYETAAEAAVAITKDCGTPAAMKLALAELLRRATVMRGQAECDVYTDAKRRGR